MMSSCFQWHGFHKKMRQFHLKSLLVCYKKCSCFHNISYHRKKTSLYDDVIENMYLTPEILSFFHSDLARFSDIGNEGISPAKTDTAAKIKGFIFLEFANSLRSRRDRSFNVRRHHPKLRFRKIGNRL